MIHIVVFKLILVDSTDTLKQFLFQPLQAATKPDCSSFQQLGRITKL